MEVCCYPDWCWSTQSICPRGPWGELSSILGLLLAWQPWEPIPVCAVGLGDFKFWIINLLAVGSICHLVWNIEKNGLYLLQCLPSDRVFSSMARLHHVTWKQASCQPMGISQSALLASSYLKDFPCSLIFQRALAARGSVSQPSETWGCRLCARNLRVPTFPLSSAAGNLQEGGQRLLGYHWLPWDEKCSQWGRWALGFPLGWCSSPLKSTRGPVGTFHSFGSHTSPKSEHCKCCSPVLVVLYAVIYIKTHLFCVQKH